VYPITLSVSKQITVYIVLYSDIKHDVVGPEAKWVF